MSTPEFREKVGLVNRSFEDGTVRTYTVESRNGDEWRCHLCPHRFSMRAKSETGWGFGWDISYSRFHSEEVAHKAARSDVGPNLNSENQVSKQEGRSTLPTLISGA